jgi:hypothetical protein
MRHPSQRQVLAQIRKLEKFINDWRMIPATGVVRNRVFLALLSKGADSWQGHLRSGQSGLSS